VVIILVGSQTLHHSRAVQPHLRNRPDESGDSLV
jgi:hypothetical protein